MSIDYEYVVIGGLVLNPSRIDETDLLPDDFKCESYRLIFGTILDMIAANQVIDAVTISDKLYKSHPDVQWLPLIGGAAKDCVSPSNISSYAKLLKEESKRSKAKAICADLLNNIDNETDSTVDNAVKLLMELSRARQSHEHSISQAMGRAIEIIQQAADTDGTIGIPTGITRLDEVLGGFHDSDLYVIGARPAMGKELWIKSKVMTKENGWIEIGKLRVGDQVASIDGEDSFVTGVFPQGKKSLFSVKFRDGRSVLSGLDHQWEVMYRDWDQPRVLTTSTLIQMLDKKRYHNRLSINLFSGDYGNDIGVTLDPWMLGALLGDGCMSDKKGGVHFSSDDKHIVDKFNNALPDGYFLKNTMGVDYSITGAGKGNKSSIRSWLEDLGVYGCLSYDKHVPKPYMDGTRKTRLAVLQGIMDTDGWVEKTGSVVFCSASKMLAEDVVYLVRSIGGTATIKEKRNSHAGAYNVYIQHSNPKELFTLPRKVDRTRESHTHSGKEATLRLTIKSIDYEREDEAFCISVSHNRALYITEDFIVTHNTAFLLNLIDAHTEQCGLISAEQPAEQIGIRLIAINGRVNAQKMRSGTLEEFDYQKLTNTVSKFHQNNNIWINDRSGISIVDVIRQARKWKHQHNIKALYIDYIQRIKWTDQRIAKWEQVGNVVMSLKELARDLNIPVIALAQVNREVEKRADKQPTMGDLANSSEIEKEADVIMTLYRDEAYNEDSQDKGIMEVGVCKNRHGPTGIVRTVWVEHFMRVENYQPEYARH